MIIFITFHFPAPVHETLLLFLNTQCPENWAGGESLNIRFPLATLQCRKKREATHIEATPAQ